MPVQQIGLDYSWLTNLADIIAQARGTQPVSAKPTTAKQVGPVLGQGPGPAIPGGPTYQAGKGEKTQYQIDKERRREDLLAERTRKHEILLKQMEIDSKLAEAMSKERIAGVGAEAGVEQAQIGAAGQVAATQRTTMEKGYELIDALWKMDKPSRDGIISGLEAKRAEKAGQAGERPISTISSGGVTMELPGTTEEVRDPEDPLTWLEAAHVYNSETGISEPKPTGAAKNEVEEFYEMVDGMIGGDIAGMAAMLSEEGGTAGLMEKIEVLGAETGQSQEVIDKVKEIYRVLTGASEPSPTIEPPSKEGGGLSEAIGGALTPFGVGREELPPEAVGGSEAYLGGAGAFEELPKVEKAPGFAKTLEEFIETVVTGPFHPAYVKWKDKRTGKPVVKEPVPAKEVGEITEQDVITDMGTWSKEKIEEFQTVAKEAGIYKGPINGLHSNELDSAMKEYFKGHKEEWGETK